MWSVRQFSILLHKRMRLHRSKRAIKQVWLKNVLLLFFQGVVSFSKVIYLTNCFLQGEKIQTILKTAKVDVEPYWPGLFAKALEGVNVKDLLSNVGSGVGAAGAAPAAAPAAGGAAPAAAAAKEEAKKEESEESDDDMGFGLFD